MSSPSPATTSGRAAEVNDAIEAAHREGVLTRASVDRDGPRLRRRRGAREGAAGARDRAPPRALRRARREPAGGRAGPRRRRRPLPGEPGARRAPLPGTAAARSAASSRASSARSSSAASTRGLALDYVDGHHHLHMHPVVFDLLLAAARGAQACRGCALVHEDGLGRTAPLRPADDVVPAVFARARAAPPARGPRRAASRATRASTGCAPPESSTRRSSCDSCAGSRRRSVEIYLHPSRASEAGRAQEAAVRSPAVRRAVAERATAPPAPSRRGARERARGARARALARGRARLPLRRARSARARSARPAGPRRAPPGGARRAAPAARRRRPPTADCLESLLRAGAGAPDAHVVLGVEDPADPALGVAQRRARALARGALRAPGRAGPGRREPEGREPRPARPRGGRRTSGC